ncbi:ABC transporter permease (plasmid) [Methylobacterium sp. NMS14P]|uniref:ABC transporter permease n=1 Tax=Methylobacterium sp. NMS14P TaxID=2894310 RepID=UPI002359D9F5|nr:ABC transporter permease [Methylobacterium sp. NMS14P]WCS28718.1 ABC transporter permease [Methylobacterium sp. NMS14P]
MTTISTLPAARTGPARPRTRRRVNASALVGGLILVLILSGAAAAPVLYPGDPLDMVASPFIWPGTDPAYPLGTDMLGRDIAAGILHGARISLLIGWVATLVSLTIGVTFGAVAGFYGGRIDWALMRVTELVQTIPPFLFALAIVAILRPSVATIVIAIGLTAWPSLARLVRAEVLRLRNGDFVQASISVGASHGRILLLEVLPNALAPVIVSASILIASAILTESSLAFLGLGDPNVASWGGMVGAGREVLRTDWYIATLPGLAIVAAVLGLNLLGDGLNDLLDIRR